MSAGAPKVTIGLPVRNGERFLERAINSVLGQTYDELELVISDNASTDRTQEICGSYASRDPRVRVFRNDGDIGVLRNFNRMVGLARGEYFRWLGVDDWFELDYVAECVAALDDNPHCIGVTTYQAHWGDAGERRYKEYIGPRVDSDHPHERFARMLWFLQQDILLMDPIFSMFRRDKLAATHLHRIIALSDRVLAAELSIVGPYCHVPRHLANRRYVLETSWDVTRRVRPPDHPDLDLSLWSRVRALLSVIQEAPLTRYQELYCVGAAANYYRKDLLRDLRTRLHKLVGPAARRIGLTRSRLGALPAPRRPRD